MTVVTEWGTSRVVVGFVRVRTGLEYRHSDLGCPDGVGDRWTCRLSDRPVAPIGTCSQGPFFHLTLSRREFADSFRVDSSY